MSQLKPREIREMLKEYKELKAEASRAKEEIEDPCDLQNIVDGFEAIDNNNDKRNYIANILDNCGSAETPTTKTKPKKEKKKRKMSAWNCFLKMCAAADNDMNFQECMKNKEYKEKEYIPNKDKYANLAEEGCPTD